MELLESDTMWLLWKRGGDVESWDIIFNPDEISKYADCGVAMLDAQVK